MQCYRHPENPAIGTCTACGRAVCSLCAVDVQGKLLCRDCLSSGKAAPTAKDPNTAFLIELLAGFFGLLGIGYLYAGRTNDGILRLVIWIVYNIIAWVAIVTLSAIIVGVICIPFQLAIQIGVPIWSALTLKKQMTGGSQQT